jgi:predicted DCC family thiol-disulfide oxidoreductase YuxK
MARGPYFIFYDGHCRICARSRQTLQRIAPASADLRFVDIRHPASLARFPMINPAAVERQMFVLDPVGHLSGGYDALVSLIPALGAARWLAAILDWPPLRDLGRRAYQWIARNRYRLGGSLSCDGDACRL